MTETGLIIAEVVFLVLLYAFVWAIVRSSSRQLSGNPTPPPTAPQPPPEAAPPPREPAMAAAAPPERRARAAAAPAARSSCPRPPPAARRDPAEVETELGAQGSGALDLSANLDPRLVVESSPTLEAGREIPLEGGITIGRSEAADVRDRGPVRLAHARPGHAPRRVPLRGRPGLDERDLPQRPAHRERRAAEGARRTCGSAQSILRYEE